MIGPQAYVVDPYLLHQETRVRIEPKENSHANNKLFVVQYPRDTYIQYNKLKGGEYTYKIKYIFIQNLINIYHIKIQRIM